MKAKARKKPAGKLIRITEKEAYVLMGAVEIAMEAAGPPECGKCAKLLFSAVDKFDSTFKMGILDESDCD